jgi:hypothetical protein
MENRQTAFVSSDREAKKNRSGSYFFINLKMQIKHLNNLYRQPEVTNFQFLKFCDSLLMSRLYALENRIDSLSVLL